MSLLPTNPPYMTGDELRAEYQRLLEHLVLAHALVVAIFKLEQRFKIFDPSTLANQLRGTFLNLLDTCL